MSEDLKINESSGGNSTKEDISIHDTPFDSLLSNYSNVLTIHSYQNSLSSINHLQEMNVLRFKYGDQVKDETILFRYLRGYKYVVDEADTAIKNSLTWRKENDIDAITAVVESMHQFDYPNGKQFCKCFPHV